MEIRFWLHYQENLSEESSGLFATTTCVVIGLSLPLGLEATLPVTLRANGFSAIFSFSLRPNLISSCFSHISLAPIGRARASGLPLGNGAGRDPRNPGKRGKIYF